MAKDEACREPDSRGVHWLWFVDGEFAHLSTGAADFRPTNRLDDQFYMIVDVRNPQSLREVGRWWLPGTRVVANLCTRAGRFGAHNLHPNFPSSTSAQLKNTFVGSFFNGGVRIYRLIDVALPGAPPRIKELAFFIPPAPPAAPVAAARSSHDMDDAFDCGPRDGSSNGAIQINHMIVDEKGLTTPTTGPRVAFTSSATPARSRSIEPRRPPIHRAVTEQASRPPQRIAVIVDALVARLALAQRAGGREDLAGSGRELVRGRQARRMDADAHARDGLVRRVLHRRIERDVAALVRQELAEALPLDGVRLEEELAQAPLQLGAECGWPFAFPCQLLGLEDRFGWGRWKRRNGMLRSRSRPLLHVVFQVGVVLKGINGLLELIGGVLLLFVPPSGIRGVIGALTQHELSEDPRDFLATHLVRAAHRLSASEVVFAALYLIIHGLVKVLLVWALLRSKLWAYPAAMLVFAAFGGYQMYQYALQPSFTLLALTVLDGFVIVLTWLEYRRLRTERAGSEAARAQV